MGFSSHSCPTPDKPWAPIPAQGCGIGVYGLIGVPGPWCVPQPSPPGLCAAVGERFPYLAEQRDLHRPLLDLRPCHIPDPAAPLVLINLLCQKQWHRSSASTTNGQCSPSPASEGEQPQGHPTHLPAPTFGVQPGPVPCSPASPCSRPPGSLLLSGCQGWDAIHTHPSSAALQREERSARPCWDHPPYPGDVSRGAGQLCASHSQEWNLFPWSTLHILPLCEREMSGAGCALS